MNSNNICLSLTVRKRSGMLESRVSTRRLLQDIPQGQRPLRSVVKGLIRSRFVTFKPTLLDEPELDSRIAKEALCQVVDLGRLQLCHPATVVRVRRFKAKPFTTSKDIGLADLPRISLAKDLPLEARFRGFCVYNHAIKLDELTGLNTYARLLTMSWKFMASGDSRSYLGLIDRLWMYPSFAGNNAEADRAQLHAVMHPWVDGLVGASVDHKQVRFVRVLNSWLKANGAEEATIVREPVRPAIKPGR